MEISILDKMIVKNKTNIKNSKIINIIKICEETAMNFHRRLAQSKRSKTVKLVNWAGLENQINKAILAAIHIKKILQEHL